MSFIFRCQRFLNKLWPIVPLAYRIVLGYGFFIAGLNKFRNVEQTIQFFEKIGFMNPSFHVYLVAIFELICGILIFVGFLTRLASIPLMIVMLVALETVFCQELFGSCMTGFEVPFYFFLLLAALLFGGPGVVSLDAMFFKEKQKE